MPADSVVLAGTNKSFFSLRPLLLPRQLSHTHLSLRLSSVQSSLSPCHHLFVVTLLCAWLRLEACQEFLIGNTMRTVIAAVPPGRDPGLGGDDGRFPEVGEV